jgi:protein TonB
MGGLVAALAVEALLLLMLLFLTPYHAPDSGRKAALTVVTITSQPAPRPTPERAAPPQSRTATHPVETPPQQPTTAPPADVPPPPVVPLPQSAAVAPPAQTQGPPSPPRQVYGPPAPGPDPNDTPIVGTAPNGEPLYAAAWYREPYDDELRGYLSTAQGPGWGLIACRTVPDFRVEDCVGLGEQPEGSNIQRSVLAAAWQFRVRPPRRGGKVLWGSWVRIRIDYMERMDSPGGRRR